MGRRGNRLESQEAHGILSADRLGHNLKAAQTGNGSLPGILQCTAEPGAVLEMVNRRDEDDLHRGSRTASGRGTRPKQCWRSAAERTDLCPCAPNAPGHVLASPRSEERPSGKYHRPL